MRVLPLTFPVHRGETAINGHPAAVGRKVLAVEVGPDSSGSFAGLRMTAKARAKAKADSLRE